MMKWRIPAKTFLLGEYAAMAGLPAMILTTEPCFELICNDSNTPALHGIHKDSPAGRWWAEHNQANIELQWHDPYQAMGGLGASSAQFIGVYQASMAFSSREERGGDSFETINQPGLQQRTEQQQSLLEAYYQYAWQGQGVRPSGYDVLAQMLNGCVFLNGQQALHGVYGWPFQELGFFVLHTGRKLATHQHLQTLVLPEQLTTLASIVALAKQAFDEVNDAQLVDAVNAYHQQLTVMGWITEHSLGQIDMLKKQIALEAVKGCGAMGSDTLLLLVAKTNQSKIAHQLTELRWQIIATQENIYAP